MAELYKLGIHFESGWVKCVNVCLINIIYMVKYVSLHKSNTV